MNSVNRDHDQKHKLTRRLRTIVGIFTQATTVWSVTATIAAKLTAAGGLGVISAALTAYFSTVVFLIHDYGGTAALVSSGIIFGIVAFLIKVVLRFWYGMIEVVVGSSAIYLYVPGSLNLQLLGIGSALQIAGGLYIIVRGLDNMYEGLRPSNPLKQSIEKLRSRRQGIAAPAASTS
jgi:hypothetical protein